MVMTKGSLKKKIDVLKRKEDEIYNLIFNSIFKGLFQFFY